MDMRVAKRVQKFLDDEQVPYQVCEHRLALSRSIHNNYPGLPLDDRLYGEVERALKEEG